MKRVLLMFIVCSVLTACCKSGQQEPDEIPVDLPCGCGNEWLKGESKCQKVLIWDYPVKPGSEEWEKHTTIQERIDAVQVPEIILSILSTEELTYLCLENPMGSLFVYSPFDRGLDTIFVRYNCFRELLSRHDAVMGLLNWYLCTMQNLSLLKGDASDSDKGQIVRKIATITLLLTRCPMPDETKAENLKEILKLLYCGYEKMFKYPDLFGSASFEYSFYTRAKIIIALDEKNLEQIPQMGKNQVFINGKYDEITKVIINDLSCQLIN